MATVYYVHNGPFSGYRPGKEISLDRIIDKFQHVKPHHTPNPQAITIDKPSQPPHPPENVVIEIGENEVTESPYNKAGFYSLPLISPIQFDKEVFD